MGKFVSQNNLSYFWQKIKTLLSGKADKSEIPTNTVKYSSQTLTDAQKTQARTNIGAGTSSFSGSYNDLSNKPTIPDVSGKLDKTTYEFNKELAIGSTGKVLVGKFPMYDSNVTISVSSTTNTTYYGTLVIATQNINDSHGGSYVANVYGDPTGTLADSFVVKYPTNSRVFEVYCDFPSWSKNIIHVQAVALNSAPSNIVELVTTIPTDSLVTVNNVLKSAIPTNTNQLTNGAGFVTSSGSVANATKLNNQEPSYYLNYNNLSNKPSIPDTSGFLKLDGSNTMTGVLNLKATGNNETNIGANGIRWGTTSLPEDTAPQYICTIDGFANGGRQKWTSLANLKSKLGVPTVNNGTLTIQQNGTTVGTFTANQSGNSTINITAGGGATLLYSSTGFYHDSAGTQIKLSQSVNAGDMFVFFWDGNIGSSFWLGSSSYTYANISGEVVQIKVSGTTMTFGNFHNSSSYFYISGSFKVYKL